MSTRTTDVFEQKVGGGIREVRLFDNDQTVTKEHSMRGSNKYGFSPQTGMYLEVEGNRQLPSDEQRANQYAIGKEFAIKDGMEGLVVHQDSVASVIVTYHNNPSFVAGIMSKTLGGKELTYLGTRFSEDGEPVVAVDLYSVPDSHIPVVISYLPYTDKFMDIANRVLPGQDDLAKRSKNKQINFAFDILEKMGVDTATTENSYFDDSKKNIDAAVEFAKISDNPRFQRLAIYQVEADSPQFQATPSNENAMDAIEKMTASNTLPIGIQAIFDDAPSSSPAVPPRPPRSTEPTPPPVPPRLHASTDLAPPPVPPRPHASTDLAPPPVPPRPHASTADATPVPPRTHASTADATPVPPRTPGSTDLPPQVPPRPPEPIFIPHGPLRKWERVRKTVRDEKIGGYTQQQLMDIANDPKELAALSMTQLTMLCTAADKVGYLYPTKFFENLNQRLENPGFTENDLKEIAKSIVNMPDRETARHVIPFLSKCAQLTSVNTNLFVQGIHKEVKALMGYQHYQHATLVPDSGRRHSNEAIVPEKLKYRYQNLRGDALKTHILMDMQQAFKEYVSANSHMDIKELKKTFKSNHLVEFSVLEKDQGRGFLTTSSMKAFDKFAAEVVQEQQARNKPSPASH